MNRNLRKAYTEVSKILEVIEEELTNKIPVELKKFFVENSDKYHLEGVDYSLEEGKLLDETLAIIAFLNLKYWVKDKEEYERLLKIYKENEGSSF